MKITHILTLFRIVFVCVFFSVCISAQTGTEVSDDVLSQPPAVSDGTVGGDEVPGVLENNGSAESNEADSSADEEPVDSRNTTEPSSSEVPTAAPADPIPPAEPDDPFKDIENEIDAEQPVTPPPPSKKPAKAPKGATSGNFTTYGGFLLGAGSAHVNFNDWVDGSEKSIGSDGYYVNPVLCMIIIIPPFCGQTEAGFSVGVQDETRTSVSATRLAGKVKYLHEISGALSAGGGIGAYCEIPPATKNYDGAGFLIHAGAVYRIHSDLLILADIEYSNGYFGMGHDSTKNSIGINAGVLTRLGNL